MHSYFKELFGIDVTFVCFGVTVLCRVPASFDQTLDINSGFPLSKVISVSSCRLNVLYWLLDFCHRLDVELYVLKQTEKIICLNFSYYTACNVELLGSCFERE